MAEVRWSPRAARDLEDTCDYIARDSPAAARRLAQRVIEATRRLADFPQSGRIAPEFGRDDIREVIVQNYRVIYRLVDNDVQLVTIQHAGRRLDASTLEDTE